MAEQFVRYQARKTPARGMFERIARSMYKRICDQKSLSPSCYRSFRRAQSPRQLVNWQKVTGAMLYPLRGPPTDSEAARAQTCERPRSKYTAL